jgi:tetratricopeptide (TPR) repeat protein
MVRPSLVQSYRRFLDDHDRSGFMMAVSVRYAEPTLQRLLRLGDRVTRRAAALALGSLGTHDSVDVLGQALQDADRGVRLVAEDGLRSLWTRAAGPQGVYAINRIGRLNHGQLYDLAADAAEELLDLHPDFGEAWHQLGIACLGVADYERSRDALSACVRLEPHHFLAAQRLARVLLACGDPYAALQRLGETLDIHPHCEQVRMQLEQLRRSWHKSQ